MKTNDKVITLESLSALHEYDKNTYMSMVDPTCSGTMMMDGDANFYGNMTVGSLMLGSNIKLTSINDSLQIVFLKTIENRLLSSEGYILKDSNGLYLTLKEGE